MGKVWKIFPTIWLCPCLNGQVPELSLKLSPGWGLNFEPRFLHCWSYGLPIWSKRYLYQKKCMESSVSRIYLLYKYLSDILTWNKLHKYFLFLLMKVKTLYRFLCDFSQAKMLLSHSYDEYILIFVGLWWNITYLHTYLLLMNQVDKNSITLLYNLCA